MKKLILCSFVLGLLLTTTQASAYRIRLHGDRYQDPSISRTLYHLVKQEQDVAGFKKRATLRRSSWQELKNIRYEPSKEKLVGNNIDYPKRRFQRAYLNKFHRQYLKPKAQIEATRATITAKDDVNFRKARRQGWIRRMLESYEFKERIDLK